MRCHQLLFALVFAASGLAAQQPAAPAQPVRENGLFATLHTSMGDIVLRLFEKEAPKTVRNFVGLATGRKRWQHPRTRAVMIGKPYFNGVIFHRIMPGFMAQTGDPLGTGEGGPGFTIPDESDPSLRYDRPGRVGMANIGLPNTGGAQFFITYVPTPHLDGKHTIFGQVVEGTDVLDKMTKVELLPNERGELAKPATPIKILKVSIERIGPEPTPPPAAAPRRPTPQPKP
jgi:cyclophilin family peptidyl-prolyl cis-trans isomerase